MRILPLAMLCGCGWIAGLGSYATRDDASTIMGDAVGGDAIDAPANCSGTFGSNGVCPSSLTAGVGQTCVIAPDGLYCWGQNNIAASTAQDVAVKVAVGDPALSVELSSSADPGSSVGVGCYLETTGDVLACWGDSQWGQVQTVAPNVMTPEKMIPGGITRYAVGADHVCAADTGSATVVCWGRTDDTELNNSGTFTDCGAGHCSITAVDTADIATTGAFVAGQAHTCVSPNLVAPKDQIGCWGANVYGQLGGDFGGSSDMIEEVDGVGEATELALGATHTCAIVGGRTYCWGANDLGQLGTGATASRVPVPVSSSQTFKHIAAGTNTTCGIGDGGMVWCWGDNAHGECGQGGSGLMLQTVAEPMMVADIVNATAIAVGDAHACAALADGDIMCWGDNTFGELGDSHFTHPNSPCEMGDCSPTPVKVTKQ